MRIVCIGAGNVATHLAEALSNAGHTIVQIVSQTEQHASALAHRLNASWTTQVEESLQAELYIYSVSDAVLADLINRNPHQTGLHIHTAGSIPISVFEKVKPRCGVLYPLQTFSKNKAVNFKEIPLFIEAGSSDDLKEVKELASLLSLKVYEADSCQRQQLHLAAVFSCNFTNHLFAIADALLKESNLPFEVLRPLIQETLDKTASITPAEAQTGPAVRNDQNVMNTHLKKLAHQPQWQEIYRLLSMSIQSFK